MIGAKRHSHIIIIYFPNSPNCNISFPFLVHCIQWLSPITRCLRSHSQFLFSQLDYFVCLLDLLVNQHSLQFLLNCLFLSSLQLLLLYFFYLLKCLFLLFVHSTFAKYTWFLWVRHNLKHINVSRVQRVVFIETGVLINPEEVMLHLFLILHWLF